MKCTLIYIALIISSYCSIVHGQQCFVSPGIYMNETNKAIIECWKGYLNSNPDSLYDNPYWNDADKVRYKSYDLLRSEGYLSPSLYHLFKRGFNNEIIQIEPMGDAYVIHSSFYRVMNADGQIYPLASIKVIVEKEENGNYKLHNWLEYYTRNWMTKKVGLIRYIYHPQHPFNLYKAEQANHLLTALVKKMGVSIDCLDYYIAPTCADIYKLKGFEDVVGMYCSECNNLCGFTDQINNIIYSNSIEGENYTHELMRLIVNFYPNTEAVFINGLAAYVGGIDKVGLPISEHLKRMNQYLEDHQEINLSDLDSWYQMDDTTNPTYYIGAIICHLCVEKGGLDLLKKGMAVDPSNPDALYDFIERTFKVKREKLDSFMRHKIHQYGTNGFMPFDFLAE